MVFSTFLATSVLLISMEVDQPKSFSTSPAPSNNSKAQKLYSRLSEDLASSKSAITISQMLGAFLTVCEGVQIGPSNAHGTSTKGDCLENVGASLETTINIDLQFTEDIGTLFAKLEQHKDARLRTEGRAISIPRDLERDKNSCQLTHPMIFLHGCSIQQHQCRTLPPASHLLPFALPSAREPC